MSLERNPRSKELLSAAEVFETAALFLNTIKGTQGQGLFPSYWILDLKFTLDACKMLKVMGWTSK
jgi:hypothetical protein